MALRPMAKELTECDIGDGSKASYWFDNWAPHGPLIEFIGPSGPRLMGIPLVATVREGATLNSWRLPSSRSRSQELLALR